MKPVLVLLIGLALQSGTSNADAVLARMDGYLALYEPRLSELVADEVMTQDVKQTLPPQPSSASRGLEQLRIRRAIHSEVAFIALPEDAGWLGFRNVKAVDGKPVTLAERSLAASLSSSRLDTARLMLHDSAAYNLGLPRTTNLPNLPLEFLHPRNRRRLLARIDGQATIRGVPTTRLVLLERMTPTLIQNPIDRSDMPSVIRAWVDMHGRLLRAEVSIYTSLSTKQYQHHLRVEFIEDRALQLLVPAEMFEDFPVELPGSGRSTAKYSNLRRFQTAARIVPQ